MLGLFMPAANMVGGDESQSTATLTELAATTAGSATTHGSLGAARGMRAVVTAAAGSNATLGAARGGTALIGGTAGATATLDLHLATGLAGAAAAAATALSTLDLSSNLVVIIGTSTSTAELTLLSVIEALYETDPHYAFLNAQPFAPQHAAHHQPAHTPVGRTQFA